MSDNKRPNEEAVDRRTETVVTQKPGYASTEHVTRDVAGEQRVRTYKYSRFLWTILSIVEIFLGLRFVLKAIGANPDTGFSKFIYGATGWLIAPFKLLVGTPVIEGSVIEVTTLIAMAVYALFFWIIVRLVRMATDRSTAQTTVTHSAREQDQDRTNLR